MLYRSEILSSIKATSYRRHPLFYFRMIGAARIEPSNTQHYATHVELIIKELPMNPTAHGPDLNGDMAWRKRSEKKFFIGEVV